MTSYRGSTRSEAIIGVGPRMPEVGSWQWVGEDFIAAFEERYSVTVWNESPPPCDVLIIIKYGFEPRLLQSLGRTPVIYCPIDAFGSSADIDSRGPLLCRCSRIVTHSKSLMRFFGAYAPTGYLDHAIRYTADPPDVRKTDGPILWVGHRSNLPPLRTWVERTDFRHRLWLLSNFEHGSTPSSVDLGFNPSRDILTGQWNPNRHVEWTALSKGAIDIKADDFRQRHKPPAKALDFLASGLPLAIEPHSAAAIHLGEMGFETATPNDPDYWFSSDYWHKTQNFGASVRQLLSRNRIGSQIQRLIQNVLDKREDMND